MERKETIDMEFAPAPLKIPNLLTVDLEDWQQSVYDNQRPVSNRFRIGLDRILTLLNKHQTQATFFVLGNIAEHSPEVVRDLVTAGHDVQTHGYDHTEVSRHTPTSFRKDITKSKSLIEDITGQPVTGYRAPRFSVTSSTLWALHVLAEEGFTWDSSIFPMRIRGYGISNWPLEPCQVTTRSGASITEIPVSVGDCFRLRFPVGGGGYFRILPDSVVLTSLNRITRKNRSLVLYCHPHEFDPDGIKESGCPLPLKQRAHQGLGRKGFARKIDRILTRFSFGILRQPAVEICPTRQGQQEPVLL